MVYVVSIDSETMFFWFLFETQLDITDSLQLFSQDSVPTNRYSVQNLKYQCLFLHLFRLRVDLAPFQSAQEISFS